MAVILTPSGFEKEENVDIPVAGSGVLCRAVSGYARFYNPDFTNSHGAPIIDGGLQGDPDDDDRKWVTHNVHMVVGPKWQSVRDVSPIVTVAGFQFWDSDDADASGTEILTCTWDTVGEPDGQTELQRIRLKVKLRMCGGHQYWITKLAYHLVAVGR